MAVELTPEMKSIESLEAQCKQLRHIVECLMITREGITELESDYIDLYNHADKYLQNKTVHLRMRKIRDKEKADIENQIFMLQQRLTQYD